MARITWIRRGVASVEMQDSPAKIQESGKNHKHTYMNAESLVRNDMPRTILNVRGARKEIQATPAIDLKAACGSML